MQNKCVTIDDINFFLQQIKLNIVAFIFTFICKYDDDMFSWSKLMNSFDWKIDLIFCGNYFISYTTSTNFSLKNNIQRSMAELKPINQLIINPIDSTSDSRLRETCK